MFDALLFDLDGTLIDSEPWHKRAEIEAFATFGIEITEVELQPYMGATLDDLLAGMSAMSGQLIMKGEFLAIEQPILTRYIADHVQMFGEVDSFLAATNGRKRAIVTSSMRWYVDAVFAKFPELPAACPVLVCAADVVQGKPHPEGYLLAASSLGVEAERCVVFEDSRNGIRAGKASGATVIGIDRHGSLAGSEADDLWPDLSTERFAAFESRFENTMR